MERTVRCAYILLGAQKVPKLQTFHTADADVTRVFFAGHGLVLHLCEYQI